MVCVFEVKMDLLIQVQNLVLMAAPLAMVGCMFGAWGFVFKVGIMKKNEELQT